MANYLRNRPVTQGVVSSFIFQVIWNGASGMISWIAARSAYFKGLDLHWAILLGVAIFFLMTLAAYVLSRIGVRPESGAGARDEIPSRGGGGVSTVTDCPDKWLHEYVDKQREFIDHWVKVEKVEYQQHDLLSESPYFDLRLSIYNGSVFGISINEVSGSLMWGDRLLGGQIRFLANSAAKVGRRETASFTLRQSLSREDAIYILNRGGLLGFRELEIVIKSAEGYPEVKRRGLNLRETWLQPHELTAAYPKLDMEIIEARLLGWWRSGKNDVRDGDLVGSVVNVHVKFKNPRSKAAFIQGFKLDLSPQIQLIAPAERRDIYDNPFAGALGAGQLLKNLNNRPLRAEQGQPFQGWLQFRLSGVSPDSLAGHTPTVIAVDLTGEEHPRGTPALVRR